MKAYFSSGALLLALQLLGCNVDVQQTDTGVTIAIECGETSSDEQPPAEQPTDKEPGIDEPAVEDPGTADPGTDEPSTDDGGANTPALGDS